MLGGIMIDDEIFLMLSDLKTVYTQCQYSQFILGHPVYFRKRRIRHFILSIVRSLFNAIQTLRETKKPSIKLRK